MGVLASGALASRSRCAVAGGRTGPRTRPSWAYNRRRPRSARAGSLTADDPTALSRHYSSLALLVLKLDPCLPCAPDLLPFVLLSLAFS